MVVVFFRRDEVALKRLLGEHPKYMEARDHAGWEKYLKMKQKFRDYSIVDKVFRVVLFLVMLFLSLTYVFMFVWIFANSLRTSSEFLINTFDIFDFDKYTFENYKVLFNTQIAGSQRNPVYLMDTIWNTVVLVFGQVLLGITIPALSGYIVAKYQFKARKMLNGVALLQLIVPTIGTLATTYSLMTTFELTNTFLGIFLMNAGGFGFSFLLFKNFFSVIPWSYAESAFLDGASDFRVFVSIMYPQSVPILTAIAVTTFIAAWNDYFTAYRPVCRAVYFSKAFKKFLDDRLIPETEGKIDGVRKFLGVFGSAYAYTRTKTRGLYYNGKIEFFYHFRAIGEFFNAHARKSFYSYSFKEFFCYRFIHTYSRRGD